LRNELLMRALKQKRRPLQLRKYRLTRKLRQKRRRKLRVTLRWWFQRCSRTAKEKCRGCLQPRRLRSEGSGSPHGASLNLGHQASVSAAEASAAAKAAAEASAAKVAALESAAEDAQAALKVAEEAVAAASAGDWKAKLKVMKAFAGGKAAVDAKIATAARAAAEANPGDSALAAKAAEAKSASTEAQKALVAAEFAVAAASSPLKALKAQLMAQLIALPAYAKAFGCWCGYRFSLRAKAAAGKKAAAAVKLPLRASAFN
jgi:Multidrug resistance efflux pump